MRPGTLIKRNTKTHSKVSMFRADENNEETWFAVVLSYTPMCGYNHYNVIEAFVTPENAVMKTYLTKEEVETLIEIVC